MIGCVILDPGAAMNEHMREFNPPPRLLLGPGPSNVHPRVLRVLSTSVLSHVDPYFVEAMGEVRQMLQQVFQTRESFAIPISGTGTAGMEAALCNVIEPGDNVVVAVNGYFGQRLVDIAARCGAQVHPVEFPWGRPLEPGPIETRLKALGRVKAVAVVHAETSTGVLSAIPELARLAHQHGGLLIMDAVTSLGGVEVAMDRWEVDVAYSGSQKCIGAPSGLAPIAFSPRAMKAVKERKTKVQSFYLDVSLLAHYWAGSPPKYHHTAPTNMVVAFREALRIIMEEGLEQRWRRHARAAAALRAGLQAMGLKLFADPDHRLDPLTTVLIPQGVDDAKVRRQLLEEYSIEIGGGLGPLAGKIWRIGLMGENAREANVFALLSALERILPRQGFELPYGESLAAAQRALSTLP